MKLQTQKIRTENQIQIKIQKLRKQNQRISKTHQISQTLINKLTQNNKNKIKLLNKIKNILKINKNVSLMNNIEENILFYMLPDTVIYKYFDQRNLGKPKDRKRKSSQLVQSTQQQNQTKKTKYTKKDDMQLQQPNVKVKVLSQSSTGDRLVQYQQNGFIIRKEIQSSAKKNKQQAKNKLFYQVRSEPRASSSLSFLHILDEHGNDIEKPKGYFPYDEKLSKKIQQLKKKGYQNY